MSRFMLTLLAVALGALLAAPAARADTCATPGVTVTAAQRTLQTGSANQLAYTLCFRDTPDRYDTQVFR